MAKRYIYQVVIALLPLLGSCNSNTSQKPQAIALWPQVQDPYHNTYTPARYKLGEKLFFEPLLSKNNTLSCASCHIPEKAFADNEIISPGVNPQFLGVRNTPSILNRAYLPHLMTEGSIKSLEHFSIAPLQENKEMHQNIAKSVEKIADNPEYISLFKEAYDTIPSIKYIPRALAVYQRYLLSKGSKFDAYLAGNTNALNQQEKAGMKLFYSERTNCGKCHSGFLLSDFKFHNIGILNTKPDSGRYRLTGIPEDSLAFKTPSLRNVGITYPYMHDGQFQSLDEVLAFYNKGGENIPRKSELIKPLGLNTEEIAQIKAFLLTLTDTIQYSTPVK
ncbi:MAG TPA: cytochrome c peroxidase [Bacteroidia bacterium]